MRTCGGARSRRRRGLVRSPRAMPSRPALRSPPRRTRRVARPRARELLFRDVLHLGRARRGARGHLYALSSAPGRAGVAVIRVSGPAASDVLRLAPRVGGPEDADRAIARRSPPPSRAPTRARPSTAASSCGSTPRAVSPARTSPSFTSTAPSPSCAASSTPSRASDPRAPPRLSAPPPRPVRPRPLLLVLVPLPSVIRAAEPAILPARVPQR